MVLIILLGTMMYAIAEELTITTYYPSPRGVYRALRIGAFLDAPLPTESATLHIFQPQPDPNRPDDPRAALRIDHRLDRLRPVVVDGQGRLGIGTSDPSEGGRLDSVLTIRQQDQAMALALVNQDGARRFGITTNPDGSWTLLDGSSGTDWTMGLHQAAGNVGIDALDPNLQAPNGIAGNLEANDVFLRSSGRWMSQAGLRAGYVEIGTGSVGARDGQRDVIFSPSLTNPPYVIITPNFQVFSDSADPNDDKPMAYWVSSAVPGGFTIAWHLPAGTTVTFRGGQNATGGSGSSLGFHWMAFEASSGTIF